MLGEVIVAGRTPGRSRRSGFTLIELLVTVAILAVLLGLGVPSMRDWMIAQRVSSVATELATDLRYARSEAISGNMVSGVIFKNDGSGCYTVYRAPRERGGDCNCTLAAGSVCTFPYMEVKTLVLPGSGDVSITMPGLVKELYKSGSKLEDEGVGLQIEVRGGANRQLRIQTTDGLHHPTVCKPSGSTISGFKPCA